MEDVNKVFEAFGGLVQKHFERVITGEASIADVSSESEDTIRYMMFHALTDALNVKPEFVFLEYPHPHVPAKKYPKLDTFVEAHNGIPSMAFEMKFTVKNTATDHNLPKTRVFGALISDLIRLKHVSDVERRYFVWVFDDDMGVYFCNRKDKWANLVKGGTFRFSEKDVAELSKTTKDEITKRIGENIGINEVTVSTVYARNVTIGNRPFGIRVLSIEMPQEHAKRSAEELCKEFNKRRGRKRGSTQNGGITTEPACNRSKYNALAEWLRNKERKSFEISPERLEKSVRSIDPTFSLPPASKRYLAWWANHKGNVQAGCGWLSAGWTVKPTFKNGKIVSVKFHPN